MDEPDPLAHLPPHLRPPDEATRQREIEAVARHLQTPEGRAQFVAAIEKEARDRKRQARAWRWSQRWKYLRARFFWFLP